MFSFLHCLPTETFTRSMVSAGEFLNCSAARVFTRETPPVFMNTGAMSRISIPQQHQATITRMFQSGGGGSSTAAAACCVARGVADELNNAIEGVSNAGSSPAVAQSVLPQGGTQWGAAVGISAFAAGGMAASWEVIKDYKAKQATLEAAAFFVDSLKQWVKTDTYDINAEAAARHIQSMLDKVKTEKWIAGIFPMGSLGLMGLGQFIGPLMPVGLASGILIDASQVAKLVKEFKSEKDIKRLITISKEVTVRLKAELQDRLKEQGVFRLEGSLETGGSSPYAKLQEQIVQLDQYLSALEIQGKYFSKKRKEMLISGGAWTAQTIGTTLLFVAALAMLGVISDDDNGDLKGALLGAALGIIVAGVGTNLKYNSRLTSSDRFAPVLMKQDYEDIKNAVKIVDNEIVDAFPKRLLSQQGVEGKLMAADAAKQKARAYRAQFMDQVSAKDKIVYQVWRNANRLYLLATLGLTPGVHGASKLKAKKYVLSRVVQKTMDSADVWQTRLEALGWTGTVSASATPHERLNQLLDALIAAEKSPGDIGKLLAKRMMKTDSSWTWKPASLEGTPTREWASSLLPRKETSDPALSDKYKALLKENAEEDVAFQLDIMFRLGACCDADFNAKDLFQHLKTHVTTDEEAQAVLNILAQDVDRYFVYQLPKNASRNISYYSEYLSAFQQSA